MLSALPRQSGSAGIGRGHHFAHEFVRGQVGVERQHLGAMDHDVGDGQFLEVEQAAEHVAVGAGDAAFLVHQIDGAFQLLLAARAAGAFRPAAGRTGKARRARSSRRA